MTNVLVTGIDGFVGSHLAEALLNLGGDRIFGLVRDHSGTSRIDRLRSRIELIESDITDFDQVRQAIDECKPDKLFHLAGQAFVPLAMADPLSSFRVNIDGGINVLESVRQGHPACSILIVSSGEVYGVVDGKSLPISETRPMVPTNPYAASKACIDLIAQQYRNSFNLNVVVARPFNHIGPGQSDAFVSSAFARQIVEIKLGKREAKLFVGNLEPKRDFTDVRDVVRAYTLLLEKPSKLGVYNVCSGKAVPIRSILTMLLELSGVKAEVVDDPSRHRTNDVPEVMGSADRLHAATGWKPEVPLPQTLTDLLAFWEERLSSEQ